MESEELQQLIRGCPLLVRMSDGREFFVEKPEFIVVADYSAAIQFRDDGTRRIDHIAFVNIASVVPHASSPKR
jgi:hypothetical protein